jgi:acyl-coenzyme A thioesterase 13
MFEHEYPHAARCTADLSKDRSIREVNKNYPRDETPGYDLSEILEAGPRASEPPHRAALRSGSGCRSPGRAVSWVRHGIDGGSLMASPSDIPAGFEPSGRTSAYLDTVGPIYEKLDGDYQIGLFVDGRHVNARGLCHGALLALLADVELGRVIARSQTPRMNIVTVDLGLSYLASAKLGDWLQASAQIDRVGRKLAFSSGIVSANGQAVLRAVGVFQVLDSAPAAAATGS